MRLHGCAGPAFVAHISAWNDFRVAAFLRILVVFLRELTSGCEIQLRVHDIQHSLRFHALRFSLVIAPFTTF